MNQRESILFNTHLYERSGARALGYAYVQGGYCTRKFEACQKYSQIIIEPAHNKRCTKSSKLDENVNLRKRQPVQKQKNSKMKTTTGGKKTES